MANQYKNEVIYNGQTLISLKEDTVVPEKVLSGETFHDKSGTPQRGSMIIHDVYDGLDSSSTDDALSANMGRTLKSSIDNCTPIVFGTVSKTLRQNLEENWQTIIPSNNQPVLVKIGAQFGACFGYLSRYDNVYGSGLLSRYDGVYYAVSLNNGIVAIEELVTKAAINAQINTAAIRIAAGNHLTFSFSNLHDLQNHNIYRHGLLVWGVWGSVSDVGLSFIFIDVQDNVFIANIAGTSRTFTGEITDGNLVITADTAVYGGLKLIWLN